jgi:hypothetical protein
MLMAASAVVAVTGGFRISVLGVGISLQRPFAMCFIAWCLLLLDRRIVKGEYLRPLTDLQARWLAALATGITVVAACKCGAFVAAGADPYGYVSQGLLWAAGNPTQIQSSAALNAPWPGAEWSFCPLGYRPSHIPGLIAPVYAPGLPLQMAALVRLLGPGAQWLVVPITGGLAVWLTYRLAARVCETREAAVVSAVIFACSPVFLFQLLQPMSDVPVTAWWLYAIVAAIDPAPWAALGAGGLASIAIATRPNLVPLLLAVAAYVAVAVPLPARQVGRRLTLFAVGAIPGIVLTAAANQTFFGSPLRSGYGSASELYSLRYAATNLRQFPAWLIRSHTILILAGLGAVPIWYAIRRAGLTSPAHALLRHAVLGLLFFALLFMCYVLFIPFDHWTYLRFFLPAIPLAIVLMVAIFEAASATFAPAQRGLVLAFLAMTLPLSYLGFAVKGDAFALKRLFTDRYIVAAKNAKTVLPRNGVALCLLQSGSLRLYGDRLTVRFDILPVTSIGEAVEYLSGMGLTPYVVLESTELRAFQDRFRLSRLWNDRAHQQQIDDLGLVTAYGPIEGASLAPQ